MMAEIYVPAGVRKSHHERPLLVERGRGPFATGGVGNVYLAFTSPLKLPVAVKIFRVDGDIEKARKRFRQEVEAHSTLSQSPFIVQYMGCYMYKHFAGVVMEHATCGSLFDFLHNTYVKSTNYSTKITFGNNLRNRIIYDIIRGIQFLHDTGLDERAVHGDVKTSNILLTGELHAKLADFGCTRFQTVTQDQTSRGLPEGEVNAITARYTACEVLENSRNKKRASDAEQNNKLMYRVTSTVSAWLSGKFGAVRFLMHGAQREMKSYERSSTEWGFPCLLSQMPRTLPLSSFFRRCFKSHYSRPSAADIVSSFPLPFFEVAAMQEAVNVRNVIDDNQPKYPAVVEPMSHALDGAAMPGSPVRLPPPPGVQHVAPREPSRHPQQPHLQTTVNQQVSLQASGFQNFSAQQIFGTFVNFLKGSQHRTQQVQRSRSGNKINLSQSRSKPKDRTILLVGDDDVGKQWLINRYIHKDAWKQTGKRPRKEVQVNGVTHTVSLLRGLDKYKPGKTIILVLLCFAIDELPSLRNLPNWLQQARSKVIPAHFPFWIVAMKEDLRERFPDQMVADHELRAVVNRMKPQRYLKCSARTGAGVESLFDSANRFLNEVEQVS